MKNAKEMTTVSEKKEFCSTEFVLKQITPMIHFQYDQDGATVRATEMKPKLDRLIWELYEKREELGECEGFTKIKECFDSLGDLSNYKLKSENGTKALNYKMRIRAEGENGIAQCDGGRQEDNIDNIDNIDVYKVHKGKERGRGAYFFTDFQNANKGSFHDTVKVNISYFSEKLNNLIVKIFPLFIAINNFGFRQNKGFGHFNLVKIKGEAIENKQEYWLKAYSNLYKKQRPLYNIVSIKRELGGECGTNGSYEDILEVINDFNQRIKSGINLNKEGKVNPDLYAKSFLMKKYKIENGGCSKNGYTNEKKFIKQKISQSIENALDYKNMEHDSANNTEVDDVRFFRGVLGFPNHYEYPNLQFDEKSNYCFKVKFDLKYIEDGKLKEVRYPSPITYIPIGTSAGDISKIFIIGNQDNLTELLKKNIRLKIKVAEEKGVTWRMKKDNKMTRDEQNKKMTRDEKNRIKRVKSELQKMEFKPIPLLSEDDFNLESFFEQYLTIVTSKGEKIIINGESKEIKGILARGITYQFARVK